VPRPRDHHSRVASPASLERRRARNRIREFDGFDLARERTHLQQTRIFSSPRGTKARFASTTIGRERRERRGKKEAGRKVFGTSFASADTSARHGRVEKFHLTIDQLNLARGVPSARRSLSLPRSSCVTSRASWHLFGHANGDNALQYAVRNKLPIMCKKEQPRAVATRYPRSFISRRGATRGDRGSSDNELCFYLQEREREREREGGRGRTAI